MNETVLYYSEERPVDYLQLDIVDGSESTKLSITN